MTRHRYGQILLIGFRWIQFILSICTLVCAIYGELIVVGKYNRSDLGFK